MDSEQEHDSIYSASKRQLHLDEEIKGTTETKPMTSWLNENSQNQGKVHRPRKV